MQTDRRGDYIQLRSGRKFWPLDPWPEDIEVADIAHALANQCRYSGHTREFWSVAQHSVLVSLACDPADALWGLLHDAAEAYLIDVPRPLKRLPDFAGPYLEAEGRIMRCVCERFGLAPDMPHSVVIADDRLLAAEVPALMTPDADVWGKWIGGIDTAGIAIEPVGPADARAMFLARFAELA